MRQPNPLTASVDLGFMVNLQLKTIRSTKYATSAIKWLTAHTHTTGGVLRGCASFKLDSTHVTRHTSHNHCIVTLLARFHQESKHWTQEKKKDKARQSRLQELTYPPFDSRGKDKNDGDALFKISRCSLRKKKTLPPAL